jgi:anti-sigma B factor antagonist
VTGQAPPAFAIGRSEGAHGLLLTVSGDVDIDASTGLREALEAAVAESGSVVVDLGRVTFIDSTGLGALVAGNNAAVARSTSLRLRAVPPGIARLFEITGLDSVLTVEPAATSTGD